MNNNVTIFATLAVVIGLVVRLLKSDTPLPTVPSRYRAFLALALGTVGGALDAVARGTPWQQAVLGGVAAAVTAMVGQELVVEQLLGGREPGSPEAPTADEAARKVNGGDEIDVDLSDLTGGKS